jgi:hypothetical protein
VGAIYEGLCHHDQRSFWSAYFAPYLAHVRRAIGGQRTLVHSHNARERWSLSLGRALAFALAAIVMVRFHLRH